MPYLRSVSTPVKVVLVGSGLGLLLIGSLAMFFRRKPRGRRPMRKLNFDKPDGRYSSHRKKITKKTANGGIVKQEATSMTGGSSKADPDVTLTDISDTINLSSQQLCDRGMEALQMAIKHWEQALERLEEEDNTPTQEMQQLADNLQHLLDRANRTHSKYEQQVFQQYSTNIAIDSAVTALAEMDKEYDSEHRRKRAGTGSFASLADDESSDADSFVSAIDVADLSDLEDLMGKFSHVALYEDALKELDNNGIQVRTLRTKMVNCASDTEFLAKLFCIRKVFDQILQDKTYQAWFMESGKEIVGDIMWHGDRDPEEFYKQYDAMMEYIKIKDSWGEIEEELHYRGVKLMTFYDIVIDFIMFDAFDDLDNPPSSVTTVVQNRWLSNGFKETALSTAVWSVLKAKRRLLRFPNGFISHFYAISEHTSPVLAWGFLGPDEHMKGVCYFFKDQILGFMRDMFSFNKVRYTTLNQLADDIVRLTRERVAVTKEHLSSDLLS